MRLNHLHLHVADVNRAAAFYQKYFAMKPHVWHGPILFMRDEGAMDLALAPGETIEPMPAWFHFGFRQPASDDVAALHRRMTPGKTYGGAGRAEGLTDTNARDEREQALTWLASSMFQSKQRVPGREMTLL